VIYFGDHLLSDLRGPSKAGWRTAAVIRELEVDASLFYLRFSWEHVRHGCMIFFFGWPVAWIQAQPNLKFHISPIDYNVSSKVALILLECWHLINFELRTISNGKNVIKCSESNLLRYLDHKSVGYAAYAPRLHEQASTCSFKTWMVLLSDSLTLFCRTRHMIISSRLCFIPYYNDPCFVTCRMK